MARKLRVQYPGAIYHVMNRGDRREPIFHADQDRQLFLQTLGATGEKIGCAIASEAAGVAAGGAVGGGTKRGQSRKRVSPEY